MHPNSTVRRRDDDTMSRPQEATDQYFLGNQDVLRFDVAVDDTLVVKALHHPVDQQHATHIDTALCDNGSSGDSPQSHHDAVDTA